MIYISGGITGVKDYMERFEKAEKLLTAQGKNTCNPAKLNASHKGKPWEWYMCRCLKWLCDCDEIYMLNGWEESRGARIEHTLAQVLRLTIIYESDYYEK